MTDTPTCPVPPAVAEYLVSTYLVASVDAATIPTYAVVSRLVAAVTAALAVPTVTTSGRQYVSREDLVVALATALGVTP